MAYNIITSLDIDRVRVSKVYTFKLLLHLMILIPNCGRFVFSIAAWDIYTQYPAILGFLGGQPSNYLSSYKCINPSKCCKPFLSLV